MAYQSDEVLEQLLQEFSRVESDRSTFETHWDEVAKYVLPFYADTFSHTNRTPGKKTGYDMLDVTANTALWRFAAAMESMLTPANGKWHRLRCSDPNLQKIRNVALWFDEVNDLLFHYRYAPTSGFQSNQHDCYVSIGAFGTSGLFIDKLDPRYGRGLRYRHIHLGEMFVAENHQGMVDKVYRRFKMTVRQIAQKWGEDKVPEKYRGYLRDKPDHEVELLHIVKPNDAWEPGRLDAKGMRFASWYVSKECKVVLERGGYHSFPYAVARYLTAPGELYGRSPAMNVLPAIKVLNKEKGTVLKQGERTVDPILLMHDDGILDGFSMKPGASNIGGVNADGRPLVHTLPIGNIAIGKELMDDERLAINDAFLVTLFQILVESPQMTATEVLERAREKGALLSPTMGRYQSEGIGPTIIREFDLLAQQGLIPDPPPELVEARGQYSIEYDAPLNRAMRSEEAAGIMRTVQFAAEISANLQDPSIMDQFNFDVIVPAVADINGAPVKYMRSEEEIAAIREGRNQQQAAAQLTQALPGVAAMTKALAPTNQGQA